MKTARQLNEGTRSLAYWWLQGYPPVLPGTAALRASVCKACPMNLPEGLFAPLTAAASRFMANAFAAKWRMNLHVEGEEDLQVCDACGCELKLKVWEPREVIFRAGNKVPGYFAKLHADCWVRKEIYKV